MIAAALQKKILAGGVLGLLAWLAAGKPSLKSIFRIAGAVSEPNRYREYFLVKYSDGSKKCEAEITDKYTGELLRTESAPLSYCGVFPSADKLGDELADKEDETDLTGGIGGV